MCRGVVVKRVRTHKTGVVSSSHTRATMKAPLVKKAKGNHLIKSIPEKKFRALSLVSATPEIEYATVLTIQSSAA